MDKKAGAEEENHISTTGNSEKLISINNKEQLAGVLTHNQYREC
jgi:hypothetical protein